MRNRSRMLIKVCLASLMAFVGLGSAGIVRADDKAAQLVNQANDGSIKLGAANATIEGPNARLEGSEDKDIIWWTSEDTTLGWRTAVKKPGNYRVELNYCLIGNNNGSPLAITVGDQMVEAIPKAGKGMNDYRTGEAGEVTIRKPGELDVVMKPLFKSHEFVINVRSILLVPAESSAPAIDISGRAIPQADDGTFRLAAADVEIDGMNAHLEQPEGAKEKDITEWKDMDTSLAWKINVRKPGKYRVELDYGLNPPSEGGKVGIQVGNQKLVTRPKPTKNWHDFKTGNAGEVTIAQAGDLRVVATPISRRFFVITLRSILLAPAQTPTGAIDIRDKPVAQSADGSFKLSATDAEIDGTVVKLDGGDNKYLLWWNIMTGFIRWPVKVDKPGAFSLWLTYSLANTDGNNRIETAIGGQKLDSTIEPGKGWDEIKNVKLGEVILDRSDNLDVVMRSLKEAASPTMYLRGVALVPIQ